MRRNGRPLRLSIRRGLLVFTGLAVGVAISQAGEAWAMPHRNLADSRAELAREYVPDLSFRVLAEDGQAGCTTKFLGRNYSTRAGAKPKLIVLHYTVSKNLAGWPDVLSIWGYFNKDGVNASSNYISDFEGNCLYSVPESAKAWTQGAANPYSISIEFIALGSERTWSEAGLRKGARIVADAAKRWGIPIRWVDPVACNFTVAGITDHNALECGNVHHDVSPYFPYATFLAYVREAATPPPPPPFRVSVDPWGRAKSRVVWEGLSGPVSVNVDRELVGDDVWRVLVDPFGPKPERSVWSGKVYPRVTAERIR